MRFLDWLNNLRRDPRDTDGPKADVPADQQLLESVGLNGPQPTRESLAELFRRTTSIELLDEGVAQGKPLGDRVLFASSDPSDIRALEHAIEIIPGGAGYCLCHGDYALVLRGSGGRSIAAIGIHHTHSIRWNGWRFDARLKNRGRLVDWLVDRGVNVDVTEAELREWSLDAIQQHLGIIFQKDGRAILRSEDGSVVLTMTISAYSSVSDPTAHSFLLRGDQIARLRSAPRAYAAYVFFWSSRIIIVPYDRLAAAMGGADATVSADGAHYVVVKIVDPAGNPTLELPAFGSRFTVSDCVISMRRPRSS